MKNKIVGLILIVIFVFMITGCAKEKDNDAVTFKKEYESLNGTENSSGSKHRALEIANDNPFVYAKATDIVKKIEDKDTFYVYFGSSYCPWCRSVMEKAIEVAKEYKIDKIYYVDIWDGDHVEILRDTYKLNDNGEVELVKEAGEGYKEILEYFDSVLGDYILTDSEGNSISVGEKRIFAPNFIYVKDGNAVKLIEGISEKQAGSRDELTEEILEDEEEQFKDFFNNEE